MQFDYVGRNSPFWKKRRENESASTHYHRCILLNSFSSFLSKRGIPSYIIKLPILRNNFVPYIFTHEEIAKLFWACDNYQSGNNDLRSSIIVMPALMRTLYATGMRISEAVSLNNKDGGFYNLYTVKIGWTTFAQSTRICPDGRNNPRESQYRVDKPCVQHLPLLSDCPLS